MNEYQERQLELLDEMCASRWMEYALQFLKELNRLLPKDDAEIGRASIVMAKDYLAVGIRDDAGMTHTWGIKEEFLTMCVPQADARAFYNTYMNTINKEEKLND